MGASHSAIRELRGDLHAREAGGAARGRESPRQGGMRSAPDGRGACWRAHVAATALTLAALACAGSPMRAGAQSAVPAQRAQTSASPPHAGELAAPAFDHEHAAWSAILARHVVGDAFDYAALAADRAAFDAYLASLASVGAQQLASWSQAERHAFWINVYNAFTIQKVIDHYPLESIRELDRGFGVISVFRSAFIPLAHLWPEPRARELSLDEVEHGILRARFEDARDHAAINCASVSCPPLRAEAFVAAELERQLGEQMRAFVHDPRRNQIDPAANRLRVSAVFNWFSEDFERDAGSVRGYLKQWLPAELHAFLDGARLEYLDYDWALNDVARRD